MAMTVPPGYGWYGPAGTNSLARKRRGNLPKEATKILKDWFRQHHDSPYPSEDEKQELCRATGLQISQVGFFSPCLARFRVQQPLIRFAGQQLVYQRAS